MNPAIAVENFGERELALHCVDLRLVELNAIARDLLSRLDEQASLRQVAAAVANDYGQPLEAVLADVQTSVVQMAALGIVEHVSPPPEEATPM
jgi:hypothetical protein